MLDFRQRGILNVGWLRFGADLAFQASDDRFELQAAGLTQSHQRPVRLEHGLLKLGRGGGLGRGRGFGRVQLGARILRLGIRRQ